MHKKQNRKCISLTSTTFKAATGKTAIIQPNHGRLFKHTQILLIEIKNVFLTNGNRKLEHWTNLTASLLANQVLKRHKNYNLSIQEINLNVLQSVLVMKYSSPRSYSLWDLTLKRQWELEISNFCVKCFNIFLIYKWRADLIFSTQQTMWNRRLIA